MTPWQILRNILLVTALTALVWVFAEAESVRSRTVRFDLSFEAEPSSRQFIRVEDKSQWTGRVAVGIEGSVTALDAIERLTRSTLKIAPTSEGIPADPGEHTLDLKTILRAHPLLRAQGVTIESVDPPSVRVEVDKLVDKELPIRVQTAGLELSGSPEVKPAVATFVIPSRLAAKLKEDAFASVVIDAAAATKLPPGKRETVMGVSVRPPIELADHPGVRIEPPSADITLTLRNRTSSIVLPRVPVTIRLPAGEIASWTVEIAEEDRFLTDVRVVGPNELVERIQRDALPVIATVTLSLEDLDKAVTTKDAEFLGLPEALRVDVENRTVRLVITRRP